MSSIQRSGPPSTSASVDLSQWWNDKLYSSVRESARPVFVFDNMTVPGASIWTGARAWTEAFRDAGLQAGDRILLHLPPGPAFIQVLIASIWDDFTLVISDSSKKLPESEFLENFDVKTIVSPDENQYSWRPDGVSGPSNKPKLRNTEIHTDTRDIRLFLKSSGTCGTPNWYGLSNQNLISVLQSHWDVLQETDTALSYLPWHHCFGLVLGLFNHLFTEK
ncbi:MAG: AMP-binding protein, partial [bacterium]